MKILDKIRLARQNEAYHRKLMEYYQEEIRILRGKEDKKARGVELKKKVKT